MLESAGANASLTGADTVDLIKENSRYQYPLYMQKELQKRSEKLNRRSPLKGIDRRCLAMQQAVQSLAGYVDLIGYDDLLRYFTREQEAEKDRKSYGYVNSGTYVYLMKIMEKYLKKLCR